MIVVQRLSDYVIVDVFDDVMWGWVKQGNQYEKVESFFFCVSEEFSVRHSQQGNERNCR